MINFLNKFISSEKKHIKKQDYYVLIDNKDSDEEKYKKIFNQVLDYSGQICSSSFKNLLKSLDKKTKITIYTQHTNNNNSNNNNEQ